MDIHEIERFIDDRLSDAFDNAGLPALGRKSAKNIALAAVLHALSQAKPTGDCATILMQNIEIERLNKDIARLTELVSDVRTAGNKKHARLIEAQNVLRQVRTQFMSYVDQHKAKTPPDFTKARTNLDMALLCETVLPELAGVA